MNDKASVTEVDLDRVVEILASNGIVAAVEQAGGEIAVIVLGGLQCGPGWFAGPAFTKPRGILAELVVQGPDGFVTHLSAERHLPARLPSPETAVKAVGAVLLGTLLDYEILHLPPGLRDQVLMGMGSIPRSVDKRIDTYHIFGRELKQEPQE